MKMLKYMQKTLMNPFIDSYPKLDVHGETRDSVIVLVKDFINDHKKLRTDTVIIVHGVGEGILKREIHHYLKTNNDVLDYKLDSFNIGVTIVKIKLD